VRGCSGPWRPARSSHPRCWHPSGSAPQAWAAISRAVIGAAALRSMSRTARLHWPRGSASASCAEGLAGSCEAVRSGRIRGLHRPGWRYRRGVGQCGSRRQPAQPDSSARLLRRAEITCGSAIHIW
jgi:hypothetical protein